MSRGLLCGSEDTCRLNDVVCTSVRPWDLSWIFLHVELDLLAIDDQGIGLDFNRTLELAVLRIIFQHVCLCDVSRPLLLAPVIQSSYSIFWLNERIVNGDDVDIFVLDGNSEDKTTNSTETVDTDEGRHVDLFICS